MDLTVTHCLDGMGQARYNRETTVEVWIRQITHLLDGMGQARYGGETTVNAWIRQSLTA